MVTGRSNPEHDDSSILILCLFIGMILAISVIRMVNNN